MIIFFLIFHFNIFLVSGSSDKVFQTPSNIHIKSGEEARINCRHEISSYNTILWYKQSEGQMELLGYMIGTAPNYEKKGVVKFEGSGAANQNCTLIIEKVVLTSTAVYFCAARDRGKTEAYFGGGTKLTVLEEGSPVTPPNVTVFPPSKKECGGQDKTKRKKTIVCVATGFYPDHVNIYWSSDTTDKITSGVATDSNAVLEKGEKEGKKTYRISSRLRVSAAEYNSGTTFTCHVDFFKGENQWENQNASVTGEGEADGESMSREKYLKITQSAKLSYTVFIVKSCFYGAFVTFLVLKLQSGKQEK